ncbi:hypothetical protein ALT785_490022 [Alteromonas infernus]
MHHNKNNNTYCKNGLTPTGVQHTFKGMKQNIKHVAIFFFAFTSFFREAQLHA